MEQGIKAPFHVILLGVIFNPETRKILIGRRENDPDIPELSWVFPGGRLLHGEDLDKKLKQMIEEETGLNVKNLGTIFSKAYPEKEDLLSVYFLCESIGGEEKAGGDIVELKWVSPDEIEKHFTTSFHPHLKEYIFNLK